MTPDSQHAVKNGKRDKLYFHAAILATQSQMLHPPLQHLKQQRACPMISTSQTPQLTTLRNKNTPVSQLPRLHFAQCLREALLAKLELLDRRNDMVVRSESKHVVVSTPGGDEARFEVITVHEEREGSVNYVLDMVLWNRWECQGRQHTGLQYFQMARREERWSQFVQGRS